MLEITFERLTINRFMVHIFNSSSMEYLSIKITFHLLKNIILSDFEVKYLTLHVKVVSLMNFLFYRKVVLASGWR